MPNHLVKLIAPFFFYSGRVADPRIVTGRAWRYYDSDEIYWDVWGDDNRN